MGLIDTIVARWAAARGYQKAGIGAPSFLLASAENAHIPAGELAANQGELYQRLTWVQGAVNIISASVASSPVGVFTRKQEDLEEVINHGFEMRLEDPNPRDIGYELIEQTANWLALAGNAYWHLNAPGPNAPPTEIWPIRPDMIEPIPDGRQYIAGYRYHVGSYETVLPVEEVVHFRRFHPSNDFVGLSPIEALAEVAVGDLNMQKWNTAFFGKDNAKLPGALAFSSPFADSLWEKMKADIKRDFGGTQRKGLFMLRGVGPDGVSWVNFGVPQKDMEFLAGRKFNKEEIMFIYGVHPGMVDASATEANATVARANFAEYTLWPIMQRIAGSITKRVLPRYGTNLVAQFEDPRVSDQRLELDQLTNYKDFMTIDELRISQGKDPIGDERGELTVIELKAGKTGGEVPEALQDFAGQQPPEETSEAPVEEPQEEETDAEEPPTPQKAYRRDLEKWRERALMLYANKGVAVGPYDSESVPLKVRNELMAGLAQAKSGQDIKDLFYHAIEDAKEYEPKPTEAEAMMEMAGALREAAAKVV